MSICVIVSHKFLTQPDDDLVRYLTNNIPKEYKIDSKKSQTSVKDYTKYFKDYTKLIKRINLVSHITHSFADASDRCSNLTLYRKKDESYIKTIHRGYDFKNYPEPIIYIKEFLFTIRECINTYFKYHQSIDLYVGMDGWCTLCGIVLRKLRVVKQVIYWSTDFVPKSRFSNFIFNKIYREVNSFGYTQADEMWDLSKRMKISRRNLWGIKLNSYKAHRCVTYGVWTKRIQPYTYDKCKKNSVVFLGHLIEKQGVQLGLEAISILKSQGIRINFTILGTGNYERSLKDYAKSLGITKQCDFKGYIGNSTDDILAEREIAKSCIAIAPYIKELDTWTKYADPGKIKKYLACGVPVITTNTSWISPVLKSKKCGLTCFGNATSLAICIKQLLYKTQNDRFRKNALVFSKSFDYFQIFSEVKFKRFL